MPARTGAGAASESDTADAPGHAPADALELATLRERIAGLEQLLDSVASERDRAYERIESLERLALMNAGTAAALSSVAQDRALPAGATESGTTAPDASAANTAPSATRESLRERISRLWRGA